MIALPVFGSLNNRGDRVVQKALPASASKANDRTAGQFNLNHRRRRFDSFASSGVRPDRRR